MRPPIYLSRDPEKIKGPENTAFHSFHLNPETLTSGFPVDPSYRSISQGSAPPPQLRDLWSWVHLSRAYLFRSRLSHGHCPGSIGPVGGRRGEELDPWVMDRYDVSTLLPNLSLFSWIPLIIIYHPTPPPTPHTHKKPVKGSSNTNQEGALLVGDSDDSSFRSPSDFSYSKSSSNSSNSDQINSVI